MGRNYRAHARELGTRGAEGAAAVPQALHRGDRARSRDPPPGGLARRSTTRPSWPPSSARTLTQRHDRGRGAAGGLRVDLPRRRDRARHPARREALHPGQVATTPSARSGPVIETELDPLDVDVTCRVNGEQRQHGSTPGHGGRPYLLVAFISQSDDAAARRRGRHRHAGRGRAASSAATGWRSRCSGIGVLKNPVV